MEWTDYAKIIIDKCKESGVPTSASFELTPFCNFSCNMCYIRLLPEQAKKQGALLTTEQWIRIAEEAKRLGTFGMEITGGEAVTRRDFPFLYESFIKMGYLISLRTNGYLIYGNLLDLLNKYKPRYISITLYGGSDETYRKICGVDDGFSVVSRNILEMRKAGITPRLTMTMTKDNIHDRAKLVDWAKQNSLFITFYGGLINPIRSAHRSIDHLKVDYGFDRFDIKANFPVRNRIEREKYVSPFWMCREYGTKFCITWDGHMTLCNCLPSVWSDALSQSVGDAFKRLYEQLDRIQRPSECTECQYIDYCGACPARFLSDAGSHEKTNESICKKAAISYMLSQNKDQGLNIVDNNNEELNNIMKEDIINEN